MADHTNRVGQRIGDYHLLRKLGGGSFGDVYLGEHVRTQTQAAVKVLQTRLTRSNELKEFINEARTFRLRHPHIIPLLDFGIDSEDIPFLVMDYAPNGTLRDKHPKGTQVPLSTILTYTTPLASALQYAHNLHLIHRDVKPENMLLNARHEVLLSDFGISTVAQSSHSINEPEGIGGTLPYMAPEQLKGKPCPASDQYALGIVVYEWLTGARPFTGTVVAVAMQHHTMPPPPLREHVPTLSPDVEQVVLTALAKDPKERFASVIAFANALEQASQTQDGETSPHVEPPPPAITSTPSLAPAPLIPTLSTVGLVEVLSPLETEQVSGPVSSLYTEQISGPVSSPPALPVGAVAVPPASRRWWVKALVAVCLVILLVASCLIGVSAYQNHAYLVSATATAAQAQINATATAAQAQINATATAAQAQINATATATQAQVNATATALASQNPYPPYGGNLVLDDSLQNTGSDGWVVDTTNNPPECAFINGAYHSFSNISTALNFCNAWSTNFVNFAYQVQMSILSGDRGGIIFRGEQGGDFDYSFIINRDGSYTCTYNATNDTILAQGPGSAIKTGLGQTNMVAVVANGSNIDLYVNDQHLAHVTNSQLGNGYIGVATGYGEAAFTNAKVWAL